MSTRPTIPETVVGKDGVVKEVFIGLHDRRNSTTQSAMKDTK
jgi:hypothetical protein